jgi:hypothetical protein
MSADTQLTCVLCGCTKDREYFDGWASCIGAPGLSGKVDIDRPECDHCTEMADLLSKLVALGKVHTENIGNLVESVAGLVTIEEARRAAG